MEGTPQFDFHFHSENFFSRNELAKREGLDPSRPWVLYTTGMPNHMPHEEELVELIADTLKTFPNSPQLLLRIYPKDRTNRFENLLKRRNDIKSQKVAWEQNYLTPLQEDLAVYSSTLQHVSLGINVASTVSLELAMFDKPIINLAFNPPKLSEIKLSYARYYEFEHYRRIVDFNAISIVTKPEELQSEISRALDNPEIRKNERNLMIADFFDGLVDGMSAKRVANRIELITLN